MNARPKRLPRLWCARMGLLPFDVVLPTTSTADRGACGQARSFSPVVTFGSDQRERVATKRPPKSV